MNDTISIPVEEFRVRLERTHRMLKERDLDGLLLFSSYQERDGHIAYLTRHRNAFPNVLSHMGMGHSGLVLPADAMGILVSPMGYQREMALNVEKAKTGYNLVGDIVEALKERSLQDKRLGVVGSDVIPFEYWEGIKQALPKAAFEAANDILEEQRRVKSQAEIAVLREAARVADAALVAGMEAVRAGATGHDVEIAVRRAALGAGAEFLPRIRVAIGPRIQTLTWPMATPRPMGRGDFVYLDAIGWVGGYAFDNSRVTVVGGPNDEQKDYLDHMAEATDWMVGLLNPGTELFLAINMSRDRQIMPFGHGIGLEVCENPWLTVAPFKTPIEPGIVINVEPIVMDDKFGGACIEEIVCVTENGPEVLNNCPRVFW